MTASPGSTLTFVNHASFLIDDGEVRLLCDPWLRGSAFNNGWDLLSPVIFDPLQPPFPTHIWLSHEHPDHFSVPTLSSIPPDDRAAITIVFQRTADGRVAGYCRRAGFTVLEVDGGATTVLGPSTSLTVLPNGTEDSAALIVSAGRTYLDLNDCMFESKNEMKRLVRGLPAPDVLLAQFSYAEGLGGPDDTDLRRANAAYFLDRFCQAAELFDPELVVPFAGFKRFGHVENEFHNDAFPLDELVAAVRANHIPAALLYPGDVLDHHSPDRLDEVAARYRADLEQTHELREAGPGSSLDELRELGQGYRERLLRVHSARSLRVLERLPDPLGLAPTAVRLWDLDAQVRVSLADGVATSGTGGSSDDAVAMHSESLRQWLDQDFGASTVLISGRYLASPAMTSRLYRWSHLGLMTAADRPLSAGYALSSSVRVARTLVRRRTLDRRRS